MTYQTLSHQLEAIFSGRDDRAIVMLRARPEFFRNEDGLAWIEHARETYGDELEVLLLPSAQAHGFRDDALARIATAGVPMAETVATRRRDASPGGPLLSAWCPCDRERAEAPGFLAAIFAEHSVGWLLRCSIGASLGQLAGLAELDACNLRRTVLDFHESGLPYPDWAAQLAHYTHVFFLSAASGDGPCGVAFDLHAQWMEEAEEILAVMANAVAIRRVAASTRSLLSLRRKL